MSGEPHWTPPPDPPTRFTARYIAVMLTIPVIALLLWLALPHSAVTVSLLAIGLLAAVFIGIGSAMLRSRDLEKPPGRHERPTPS